jgi:hypothetical protein
MKSTKASIAFALATALVAMTVAAAERPVSAAWKRHDVEFSYMGFTTHYSCDGLRDKMKVLLQQAGVRKDLKVTTWGCEVGGGRVTEFPRLRMTFYAPEIPRAGQREVGEPAIAEWKRVQIEANKLRSVELGDCELVEQFRDRILPLLTTRNVVDETSCIPHQLSGSHIDLRFEVLQGQPSPDAKPPKH